ncbi:hypothetical protein GF343_01800 [Candidatus Woesearchaeota archaeon]|nr:hypothetical protein [Candidatus Woesearchaeota archaeon]
MAGEKVSKDDELIPLITLFQTSRSRGGISFVPVTVTDRFDFYADGRFSRQIFDSGSIIPSGEDADIKERSAKDIRMLAKQLYFLFSIPGNITLGGRGCDYNQMTLRVRRCGKIFSFTWDKGLAPKELIKPLMKLHELMIPDMDEHLKKELELSLWQG